MSFDHFKGKEALVHVAEAQVQGIIGKAEIHGAEIPGSLFAALDACRDTIIFLALFALFFDFLPAPLAAMSIVSLGLFLWKMGRSGWLGWVRLERLHRILAQEKWEIEHNRAQEREELTALYAAKGLEGQLLKDVIDVLMADENRLLEVMVREELGLSLENLEHPLKQGIVAGIGVIVSWAIAAIFYLIFAFYGVFLAALLLLCITGGVMAHFNGNKLIPAIVWSLGVGTLTLVSSFFLLDAIKMLGFTA